MGLFGPEKMVLNLEKTMFKPGEKIIGNIQLNLKKPVQARKLEVSLVGKLKTRRRTSKGTQTHYEKFYDFDLPISGEQEYQNENISFELPIPKDVLDMKSAQHKAQDKLEEKLGAFGSVVGAMAMGQSNLTWYVRSQLDVPKKLDIKNKRDIVISE